MTGLAILLTLAVILAAWIFVKWWIENDVTARIIKLIFRGVVALVNLGLLCAVVYGLFHDWEFTMNILGGGALALVAAVMSISLYVFWTCDRPRRDVLNRQRR